MGHFFWDHKRGDEPVPVHKSGREPDYMMVYLDGQCVMPDRGGDGAGPNKRHMHVDEGFEVLRALYIPHDGVAHKVEGDYRVNGISGSLPGGRLLIAEAIKVDPDPADEPGDQYSHPGQVEPPPMDPVGRAFLHAEVMADRYHAMAVDALGRQERAGEALLSESRANNALVLELLRQTNRESAAQSADLARQAMALGQQAFQSAERVAAGKVQAQPAPQPGIMDQAVKAFQVAAPVAMMAWEKLGGTEGIKTKAAALLGGGAGGGTNGLQLVATTLERLFNAIETIALAKMEAGRPTAQQLPEQEPTAEAAA